MLHNKIIEKRFQGNTLLQKKKANSAQKYDFFFALLTDAFMLCNIFEKPSKNNNLYVIKLLMKQRQPSKSPPRKNLCKCTVGEIQTCIISIFVKNDRCKTFIFYGRNMEFSEMVDRRNIYFSPLGIQYLYFFNQPFLKISQLDHRK